MVNNGSRDHARFVAKKDEGEREGRRKIRVDSYHTNATDKSGTVGVACLLSSHVTCRKHIYFSELTISNALNAIAVCAQSPSVMTFFDPPLARKRKRKRKREREKASDPLSFFPSFPRIRLACKWTFKLLHDIFLLPSGCSK